MRNNFLEFQIWHRKTILVRILPQDAVSSFGQLISIDLYKKRVTNFEEKVYLPIIILPSFSC